MDPIYLSSKCIEVFRTHLEQEEKSTATIEKYMRDVGKFVQYAQGRIVTKELSIAYKQYLIDQQYAVRSINSMLASMNCFLKFMGLQEGRVKQLRQQREVFCPEEKELTRSEYLRMLDAAKNDPQISLVMQAICATGIRVSELQYFTVENVQHGIITVSCKSKLRTVFLPEKLRKSLLQYAEATQVHSGCIFLSKNGTPLDRNYIWSKMKKLCTNANVNPSKVFPHNLRKLFARSFYTIEKDIVQLADILGHSSIETTRIYIMTSGTEHRKKMEQLDLVI